MIEIPKRNNDISRTKQMLTSKKAEWMLGVIAFTESSFLPIVIDPFLVVMILAKAKSWIRYSFIAGSASVIGGIFGYLLGALFFELVGERLIALYGLEEEFVRTVELFNANAFLVIFIGAFTPIPYKIIAIAGGLLKVNFLIFIIASVIGRFLRFFIVGYITGQFGAYALSVFSRRFNQATLIIIIGVALYALMVLVR